MAVKADYSDRLLGENPHESNWVSAESGEPARIAETDGGNQFLEAAESRIACGNLFLTLRFWPLRIILKR
jgi:hypothetical protein